MLSMYLYMSLCHSQSIYSPNLTVKESAYRNTVYSRTLIKLRSSILHHVLAGYALDCLEGRKGRRRSRCFGVFAKRGWKGVDNGLGHKSS